MLSCLHGILSFGDVLVMCEIWSDDYDMCAVWSETRRRARKRHRCDSCAGAIMVGEQYLRHFSVHDGNVTDEKSCSACTAVRDVFLREHGIIGVPSRFAFELQECVGPRRYREHWGETEFRWRKALAGMLRRGRAAARGAQEKLSR